VMAVCVYIYIYMCVCVYVSERCGYIYEHARTHTHIHTHTLTDDVPLLRGPERGDFFGWVFAGRRGVTRGESRRSVCV
jgi:hypothetical protein